MTRSRPTGLFLIAIALIQLVVFLFGVSRRSYAALALPVTLAMATVSALTLWLGYTMLQIDEEVDSVVERAESSAEAISDSFSSPV